MTQPDNTSPADAPRAKRFLLAEPEARLGLIALNTLIATGVGLGFQVGGLGLTVLDLVGLAIAGAMLAALAGRAARNLRVLAAQEPAGRVSA